MAENPFGTAVLERCNIQPSSGAAAELTLPLLHFDITWLYFHPVQRLLFFDFPCSKSRFLESIVPKMKQSLALTLNHFLPLAGNIIHPLNSGSPTSRLVTGDSVSLVIAECDKDFTYLTGNHTRVSDELHGCVPQLPPAKTSSDDVVMPVLALQITLFSDQGLCLGFTTHHAIGDASSIVRFIKAWASVSKTGGDADLIENKLLPSFDRTTVQDPEGLDSIYWNLMRRSRAIESPDVSYPLNKVRRTFILTRDDLQKLKNSVLEKRPAKHITSFTVTCALVWVCLAKAEPEAVADDAPEFLCFAADCRARLQPPLPAEYFGNCLGFVKAEATHGSLKGDDGFSIAAESVGAAIQKTVNNEKGILDGAETWPVQFGSLIGKRLFGVVGSPRFDLYEVDYGWGTPRKFESASTDIDPSMSLCKSRDFEGGLEIGLSRDEKIMDAFAAIFTEFLKKL